MICNSRTWLSAAFAMLATTAVSAGVMAPQDVEIKDATISDSLTGAAGNAETGRKVFADRKLGNCLACHAVSDQSEQLFHGEVGPPLDGVGDRWSEAEMRAILVNSKAVFSESTIMPGFYTLEVGRRSRNDP